MNIRLWYRLLFLFFCLRTSIAIADQPNVLIVLVDDAGYGDFACHGHPFVKTPNIDQLHRESNRFTDFHVAPMCSPTRGQLLTGVHGLRNGVTSVTAGRTYLRPEFVTMPQVFEQAGYRTGIFGKWHLGDSYPHRPQDKGFQTTLWTRGWGFTSAPEFSNTLIDGQIIRGRQTERFDGYITDVCFNEAMSWIDDCKRADKPFFCYLPLHAAHAPHVVPKSYQDAYAGHKAAAFFGMIANIDENIGRLDAFLRERQLDQNTIVLFLTDNGGTAGVPIYNAGLRAGKVTYYDGGHRVPCFIRWPSGSLRAAGDLPHLTQVQDWMPTLLELCDISKPKGPVLDGISLAPLLRGQAETLPERTLIVQFGPGFGQQDNRGPQKYSAAVMKGDWRLVHGDELYNLGNDRGQQHNVASEHADVVAALRADYDLWWDQVSPQLNDFVPISVGAMQEPVVMLTSSDWQDAYADNGNHIRNAVGGPRGGPWNVFVERAGQYRVALRRWPKEMQLALANAPEGGKALPIAKAIVRVGDQTQSAVAASDADSVTMSLQLMRGKTQLHGWFVDSNDQPLCGAYYAEVSIEYR